jgi:hypothetical protein
MFDLRGNEDGEDGGMKERRAKKEISNVYTYNPSEC